MKNKKINPPMIFTAFLILIAVCHLLIPIYKIMNSPITYFGLIFVVIGIYLNLKADQLFRQKKTTIKPFEVSEKLVTQSVFAISRNPIYLGMVFILLGEAMFFGTVVSFFPVIIFFLIVNYYYIRSEEKMLAEKFGQDFQDYKNKVRKWL